MENSRQQAFQKLRPPCVELSSTALKFKGRQTPVKSVLRVLEEYLAVLEGLGRADALDEKLAEYAFFPLSHVFNESQRLSSRCLEVAVRALSILVVRGWRQKLAPEMGKQLLILLTLLAGGSPAKSNTEPPGDDLKVAAFECMAALTECMGKIQHSKSLFDEVGAKTIVDQTVYLLLEAITNDPSDAVQVAASKALFSLNEQISNRVILASLLPRTVSALTKALQPSTRARRTQKVLRTNLELLTKVLHDVLNDEVSLVASSKLSDGRAVSKRSGQDEADDLPVLDASWLQATSPQVKQALANVMKLRNHEGAEVQQALGKLCLMVIEECPKSLADSVPLLVETLVVLANNSEATTAFSNLKRLASIDLVLAESLKSSLHQWIGSLPRLMQGSDDRPKERILQQISTTFEILSETGHSSTILHDSLAFSLVESIAASLQSTTLNSNQAVIEAAPSASDIANIHYAESQTAFELVLLNHTSQRDTLVQLQSLIRRLTTSEASTEIIRSVLGRVSMGGNTRLAAIWLGLNLLRQEDTEQNMIDEFVDYAEKSAPLVDSKPYLVSELYDLTVPLLTNPAVDADGANPDWRLRALALEVLILQAKQLGTAYRYELIDTLYPILSLLGEAQPELRTHAMTALNLLTQACGYSSTASMLVENVDYLVNSIAVRLTLDITPQAPQVLLMMVRLCGASLIPYLDDLIGDIFVALDNFHGYPRLVELLFEVLSVVVDEGAKKPGLTITDGKEAPEHRKEAYRPSTIDDIITDLRAHKARKDKSDLDNSDFAQSAPHRPWSSMLDGPERHPPSSSDRQDDALDCTEEEEEANDNRPSPEKEQQLSRPHILLLRIAQSTPPHLASPSPAVRLTLLHLLTRIATPLSADENSFLPLINAVWPALLPRLFGSEEVENGPEPSYIAIAAAKTISALCVGAGNFMASRIEDIFPKLQKMYTSVWKRVRAAKHRAAQRRQNGPAQRQGSELKGPVELDLRLEQNPSLASKLALVTTTDTKSGSSGPSALSTSKFNYTPTSSDASSHGMDQQILNALIRLLVAILNYVRITDDMGDTILELLAPVMDEPDREDVREALECWNADAVWLAREQMRIEIDGR